MSAKKRKNCLVLVMDGLKNTSCRHLGRHRSFGGQFRTSKWVWFTWGRKTRLTYIRAAPEDTRERSLLPEELQVHSTPMPVRRERRERSSSESDLDLDIQKAAATSTPQPAKQRRVRNRYDPLSNEPTPLALRRPRRH